MDILAIDIGGTHIKFCTQRHPAIVKIKSGRKMTPQHMVEAIRAETAGWKYDHVSIGFPGPVVHNLPLREPFNLGKGWMKFRYDQAFANKPLRMINDAAMQALGSYEGGRMLFLGLGTGLGAAMVVDGIVQAMEVAHLPWKKGKTYEDLLGLAGLQRMGRNKWEKQVLEAITVLQVGLRCDSVVLGGGNAVLLKHPPKDVRIVPNSNAFEGGFRLWLPKHRSSR